VTLRSTNPVGVARGARAALPLCPDVDTHDPEDQSDEASRHYAPCAWRIANLLSIFEFCHGHEDGLGGDGPSATRPRESGDYRKAMQNEDGQIAHTRSYQGRDIRELKANLAVRHGQDVCTSTAGR
jgi:hypothetical protein